MPDDEQKRKSESGTKTEKKDGGDLPSAGPHADPKLMNADATPGSGVIAPIGVTDEPNIQSTG